MRPPILIALSLLAIVHGHGRAWAQGSPLLTGEDKFFLQARLGVAPDDSRTCRLTQAEAARLHRLIRAGDPADVRAYLDNVTLDQVFDDSHRVPRANFCVRPR